MTWPVYISSQWVNTLRPTQDGRHFPDDIFKWIFLNENVWISIEISLKFVPKGQINNIPALVRIMAWRRPGNKPLSEPMMVGLLTHICVTRPQWVKPLHAAYFICPFPSQNVLFSMRKRSQKKAEKKAARRKKKSPQKRSPKKTTPKKKPGRINSVSSSQSSRWWSVYFSISVIYRYFVWFI